MKKSNKILTTLLLIGLTVGSINSVVANNLVQMDLKKGSQNNLDMTIYTSNPYNNSMIVRKKSENKYVVLIPNVSSSIGTPDFHSVKDIISNVDVKSVNDTADGYTKVTVISKKPINIKTRAIKSAPISAEQQSYRSLLAIANTPKENSIKPIVNKSQTNQSTNIEPKNVIPITNSNNSNIKKLEIISDNNFSTNQTPTPMQQTNINQEQKSVTKNIKTDKKRTSFVKELKNSTIINNQNKTKNSTTDDAISIDTTTTTAKTKLMTIIKEVWDYKIVPLIPEQIPMPLVMVLLPLLGLIIMINLIKTSIEKSRDLKAAFVNKVKNKNNITITKKYSDITSDDSLNWKEKYQKYNDAIQNPEKYNQEKFERAKIARYSFIKGNYSDDKRQNLEKMINPIIEKTNNLVNSEDTTINEEMTTAIKLKGFAKPHGMKVTHRNTLNRQESFEESFGNSEQNNINLGYSMLHKNMRKFEDANLNILDVKRKNKSIKNLKREEDLKKQDYSISSLDEYFSIVDKDVELEKSIREKSIKMISTPEIAKEQIKENLENVEPIQIPRAYSSVRGINLSKAFANPFSNTSNNEIKMISTPKPQPKQEEQLVVNSKHDIDENHGFMMVSINNKSALIGKANDNIIVLKEFDHIINQPIKVRRDKENVYIVKAENFKSLVEIKDDNIGVLINL